MAAAAAAAASRLNCEVAITSDPYLCKKFVDDLVNALTREGIDAVTSEKYKQPMGSYGSWIPFVEPIVWIIVFSNKFGSSDRWLKELVMIMDRKDVVCPVYYDVEPSEVLKEMEKIKIWKSREALKEATSLVGWELKNTGDGHEAGFIEKIVKEISRKLHSIRMSNKKNFIGIESQLENIGLSLEIPSDVHMLGITGKEGSGKTTLARALFDNLCIQFEHTSFIENVRELSEASGMELLQKKVLSDVSNENAITISNVQDGKHMMRERLHDKKVLIVLDDVNHISQLEALAGAPNWFGPGSLIATITSDRSLLLAHKVNHIHDVTPLTDDEAILLFCRYAFGTDKPAKGYAELSKHIVHYAAGIPLTIRILGSFLFGKEELEWTHALERLNTLTNNDTMYVLESIYMGLEDDYKEIFLDVACCLEGILKDDAFRILEGYGLLAVSGLRLLEQYSLITISNQRLGMHGLIQEMGRSIVRRLHPNEPNRHSRLWSYEEIEDILAKDAGTEETRTIIVDTAVKLSSKIVVRGFGGMTNLRILHIVSEIDEDCNVQVDQGNQIIPNSLQILSWIRYPHRSLPETFQANDLVRLNLSYSRIIHLWEGGERKVFNVLKFLDLSFSTVRTLNISQTPNLERLDLENCFDLKQIDTPLKCLKNLSYLNVSGCKGINCFLFIRQLESLEVLCLTRLLLEKFPEIIIGNSENTLQELQLRYNNIEELPSSIANLQKLVYLDLHSCTKLRSLPESICGLRHLTNLQLYGCKLEELPKDIGHIECLEELNLSFTDIKHLPDSICMLEHLKILNLTSCWNLEMLPCDLDQLVSLQDLILMECARVKYIPDSICKLESLKVLNIEGTHIRLPRNIYKLKGLKVCGSKIGVRSCRFTHPPEP